MARFTVTLENDVEIKGDALLIATGYELFDASGKRSMVTASTTRYHICRTGRNVPEW